MDDYKTWTISINGKPTEIEDIDDQQIWKINRKGRSSGMEDLKT